MNFFNKVFSDDKKIIGKIKYLVSDILDLSPKLQKLPDAAFTKKTLELQERHAKGESLDDMLVEAFAYSREAARRVTGMHMFPVQLLGGVLLHYGDIAEMQTGEGKTITAICPIYLNAIAKKGVHVVTVNQYLADRDAEANGQVFNFLGLTCKANAAQMATHLKKAAYDADVTYTTNSEIGFDYLRDNMAQKWEDKVQRGLNMALVDECDSVLIDEARTPLIIAGAPKSNKLEYDTADRFAKSLAKEDYFIDLESKSIALSHIGEEKVKHFFKIKSFFDVDNNLLVHYVLNALKANYMFLRDREYIVTNKEVKLVDQFTGRVLEGRSYSDGLQQAIQSKEGVPIEEETRTVATITYQNFFRLYSKLSGMTGTAKTEEDEFRKIYNMRVVSVPTNRPRIRIDSQDFVFANKKAKYQAIVNEVEAKHDVGQPVLLGTTNVNTSEMICKLLTLKKIPYNLLNARQDKKEADVISRAGEMHSVTIATNMAGRGTDIKLGDGVPELGGLVVLGTERHESRRIDNQLRGRCGRQGDPGFSRFYLSLEDELLLRFGADKLQKSFSDLKDKHIDSKMLTRGIAGAQKRIEGMNFDVRKNTLEYDNVLSQHRIVIYKQRDQVLKKEELDDVIEKLMMSTAVYLVEDAMVKKHDNVVLDCDKLESKILNVFVNKTGYKRNDFKNIDQKAAASQLYKLMNDQYNERRGKISPEIINAVQRQVMIRTMDDLWIDHIDLMTKLKSAIHLRSYAQKNPLQQYIEEAHVMFQNLKKKISLTVIETLLGGVFQPTVPEELVPTDISQVKVGFR